MRSTPARPFVTPDDEEDRFLPEGPRAVMIEGREALVWVNIQTGKDSPRGAVHLRYWDDGEQNVWNLSGRPGFLLPTSEPGTLFLGLDKQVGLLMLATNEFHPLAEIPDEDPRTIINDGQLVPGGQAVVFGTKDTRFKDPLAALYLFTVADARVSVLADRQLCSNGKVIRADEQGLVLYDIDTPTRTVARYRLDVMKRKAEREGVAVDVHDVDGFPDGMCDAGDGTAIIAFYNPAPLAHGKAIRFDLRTGKALEEWTTPAAPRVTCPLLVRGPDGVKLIVTTATEGMPAQDFAACPGSGNLFIADTELANCPTQEVLMMAKANVGQVSNLIV